MVQKNEAQATQQLIEVEDIKNDVVILRGGALRKVLMVSGVNIDLKSEDEQNLIAGSYQNFLNGLDFSIQMLIHSRKLNVAGYLDKLSDLKNQETNDLLKNQISEYTEFIRSFVEQNPIMTKMFFVVIPFDPINIPSAETSGLGNILPFMKKQPVSASATTANTEEKFQENVGQLNQRVDQVVNGLQSIGLRAVPLNSDELVELFYNFYNPETVEKKTL